MNAVDNNPSTCCLAAEDKVSNRNSAFGWLQVDLGNPFLVISVTLTNANTGGGDSSLTLLINFVKKQILCSSDHLNCDNVISNVY